MTDNELAERCCILKKYVSSDTELFMECLHKNKVYIDSALEVAIASPEIIQMAQNAEKNGFDAVVIYCLSDPAIDAVREILNIPVIGGGQASYISALLSSRQFGLIITDKKRIPEKRLFINQTGVSSERLINISDVDLQGKTIREDIPHTLNCLTDTVNKMIQEHNVQAVILGCLSFLGMAEEVSKRTGIPVIDSAIAAVTTAEMLVKQGLFTSKLSYPKPSNGKREWENGELNI